MASRELPLNPYAGEPVSEWASRLRSGNDTEQRFRAFAAITQLASPHAVCAEALILCHDRDPELRAAAARWLSNMIRSGQFPEVLAADHALISEHLTGLLEDTDPDVRLEAARGLTVLTPQAPRLEDVLCELLIREAAHPSTQAVLVDLCGHLPQLASRTMSQLRNFMSAEAAELREAAAMALARWGAAAAPLESELAAALDDEEPLVREHAAIALAAIPQLSAAAREALQHATLDEDRDVATAARKALQRHESKPM